MSLTQNQMFGSQVGSGWSSHTKTQGVDWDDLSMTTQQLFLGVAEGWWEDVDIKRGAPIPFAKVFNIKDAPTNWTIAHVLDHFGIFESISQAKKAGWDKPLATGEFWLNKRTVRVLLIWIDESHT